MKTLLKNEVLPLGQVVVTRNAHETLSSFDINMALGRHQNYDWGEVCAEDWRTNNEAVFKGLRVLSVYRTDAGEKFWIITESDRSVTTVLLPEDY